MNVEVVRLREHFVASAPISVITYWERRATILPPRVGLRLRNRARARSNDLRARMLGQGKESLIPGLHAGVAGS